MRNLIEELQELNKEEYNVSADFSKRVMKEIKKNKGKNNFKYAISCASVGIVACLAIVLFNNSNINNNLFSSKDNNTTGLLDQNSMPNDAFNELEEADLYVEDNRIMASLGNEDDLEKSDFAYMLNDNIVEEKSCITQDSQMNERLLQIELILKEANIQVEKVEEGIKVKSTKEKIEDILKEYKDLTIEVQGEYILIKF